VVSATSEPGADRFFVDWSAMPGRETYPGDVVWPCTGDKLQVLRSELAPDSDLPYHEHPQEQIIVLLEGTLEYTVADQTRIVTAGTAIRVPGGVSHGGRVIGPDRAVCIEAFHPLRMDFGDGATAINLEQPR
jgi:quercetin dioxygenase-like cupin family protein